MSIFDGDSKPFNIPFPTLGGKVCWETLECGSGYELQQNNITKHCRILDLDNIRVAYGSEGQMRAEFRKLTEGVDNIHAQYGDVIGVHRIKRLYDHYGVYESDDCVYEYAARDGDFGEADIHITTLSEFIRDSGNYFILTFPERYGKPGKIELNYSSKASFMGNTLFDYDRKLQELIKYKDYVLYSPEETIARAKSRLGENNYNLIDNNCEHYAIWCKTGLKDSYQVKGALDMAHEIIIGNKI